MQEDIMLKGKTVVLGVTGSIAAYKIANLASMLVKLNADVHVIMTRNATYFRVNIEQNAIYRPIRNPTHFRKNTFANCFVSTFAN